MSAGFFNFAIEAGPTPGITPSYTGGPEIVPGPRGGAMLQQQTLGAFEFDMGEMLPESFNGRRQHTFMDDYYFRVYFIPAALNLGTIAEPTIGNVVVWNADFRVATMTNVVPTIGLGMSYAGDPAPYPIKAMALRTWGVLVTMEGPPALNDALNFTFDTGQFYPLTVSAFRVQPLPETLWPWTINWKDGLKISEEFKTDIIEARSGREQRRAMRSTPRKTLDFTIMLRNWENVRRYNDLVSAPRSTIHRVLDPTRSAEILVQIPPNGLDAVIDGEVPQWIFPGGFVVLDNDGFYSLRKVDTISSDGVVSFLSSDTNTWPIGTRIHPALACHLSDSVTRVLPSNWTGTVSISFNVVPGSEPEETPPAALETFEGREIFRFKPNWGESVTREDMQATERVDFGRGVIKIFTPTPVTPIFQGVFLKRDQEQAEGIRQFFNRMKGRQGEFYMPTTEEDIIPERGWLTGTNRIRVTGTEFAQIYGDSRTHRAVLIVLDDGTEIFRRITQVYGVDDELGVSSVLETADDFDFDVTLSEIERIYWVYACRFASDMLTMEWQTNEAAQTQLAFQAVEPLPTES